MKNPKQRKELKQKQRVPKSPAQKIRDYFIKKYGSTKDIFIRKKPLGVYRCQRCGENTKKSKFIWKSWFSNHESIICRECAYKESFGTKILNKQRKNEYLKRKALTKKEIEQAINGLSNNDQYIHNKLLQIDSLLAYI